MLTPKEIRGGEFFGFSFCLSFLRLGAERDVDLETQCVQTEKAPTKACSFIPRTREKFNKTDKFSQ